MLPSERDLRLDRLFALTDGVFAIALTLLAIELVLPAGSEHLHGEALLRSILDTWPKVLGFLTSFSLIGLFWHGNHRAFHYLRRFDSRLAHLMLLQLLCVAFIPFPTAVVGEHVSDPVAQVFYFASIIVTGLATMALWWYASSGHRLVDPELHPSVAPQRHPPLPPEPPPGAGGWLDRVDRPDWLGDRTAGEPPVVGVPHDSGLRLARGVRGLGAALGGTEGRSARGGWRVREGAARGLRPRAHGRLSVAPGEHLPRLSELLRTP
jgi:uncharacterized membrane protein